MDVLLDAGFDAESTAGRSAVCLAIALDKFSVRVGLAPRWMTAPLPRAFTRLWELMPPERWDVQLYFGTVPSPARVARRAVAWTRADPPAASVDALIVRDPDAGIGDHVLASGVEVDRWPKLPRSRTDAPRMLILGSSVYQRALGLAAIQTTEMPDLSAKERLEFYGDFDVLICPTSDCGPAALEFACTGGMVLGVNRGELRGWLHPDTGMLVSATSECADVDELVAAASLCIREPHQAYRRGDAAAAMIRSSMTWEHTAERLLRILEKL